MRVERPKLRRPVRFTLNSQLRQSARSSKRTVRLISGVALDECRDPERYRTRVPLHRENNTNRGAVMKTQLRQHVRQFQLKVKSYANSYYIDRIATLEKILAR